MKQNKNEKQTMMESCALYAISKDKQISIMLGFYAKIGKRLAANELLLFRSIHFHRLFKKDGKIPIFNSIYIYIRYICILKTIEVDSRTFVFCWLRLPRTNNNSGFLFLATCNAFSRSRSYTYVITIVAPSLMGEN